MKKAALLLLIFLFSFSVIGNAIVLQLPMEVSYDLSGHTKAEIFLEKSFSVTNQERFPEDQRFNAPNWGALSSLVYETFSSPSESKTFSRTLTLTNKSVHKKSIELRAIESGMSGSATKGMISFETNLDPFREMQLFRFFQEKNKSLQLNEQDSFLTLHALRDMIIYEVTEDTARFKTVDQINATRYLLQNETKLNELLNNYIQNQLPIDRKEKIWISGLPYQLELDKNEKKTLTFHINIPAKMKEQDLLYRVMIFPTLLSDEKIEEWLKVNNRENKAGKNAQMVTQVTYPIGFPIAIFIRNDQKVKSANLDAISISKSIQTSGILNFHVKMKNNSPFAYKTSKGHVYIRIFKEDQLIYENEPSLKRGSKSYDDQGNYIDTSAQNIEILGNKEFYLSIPWMRKEFPEKGTYRFVIEIPEIQFKKELTYEEKATSEEKERFEEVKDIDREIKETIPIWIWFLIGGISLLLLIFLFLIAFLRRRSKEKERKLQEELEKLKNQQ